MWALGTIVLLWLLAVAGWTLGAGKFQIVIAHPRFESTLMFGGQLRDVVEVETVALVVAAALHDVVRTDAKWCTSVALGDQDVVRAVDVATDAAVVLAGANHALLFRVQ